MITTKMTQHTAQANAPRARGRRPGKLAKAIWLAVTLILAAMAPQANAQTATSISATCLSQTKPSGVYTAVSSGGGVWGNNASGYTVDSDIGVALVHSGLLAPGASAYVVVAPLDTKSTFVSTTANGITTSNYSSNWCGMALALGNQNAPAPTLSLASGAVATVAVGQPLALKWVSTNSSAAILNCQGSGYHFSAALPLNGTFTTTADASWITAAPSCSVTAVGPGGSVTQKQSINVTSTLSTACQSVTPASGQFTGAATGNAWGNNDGGYTTDSNLGLAMVHAGLGTVGQTMNVVVIPQDTTPSFTGTTANGVTTSSYGSPFCGIHLVAGPFNQIAITPPLTVALTNPAANTTIATATTVSLQATASTSAPNASIASVAFFANGNPLGVASQASAPYNVNWTPSVAGTYSMTVNATDSNGISATSAPVIITVTPQYLPTITLTSPGNGQILTAPATLTLAALATETNGTITQVAFFNSTSLMGTVNQPPYNITFPDAEPGTYSITAQATDNAGQSAISAAVTLTVVPVGGTGGATSTGGGERVYDIHTDQLNTPRLITDSNGNAVWQWSPDEAFGNSLPNQDPNGTGNQFVFNLRFPGQYYDQETGTHYNVFRDYDPATGRYIESDPIGLMGGINTYGYAGGNPAGFSDPKGQCFACEVVVVGGIIYYWWLTHPIIPAASVGGQSDWVDQQAIEKEANRRQYKSECDDPPPPGGNACDNAQNELRNAQRCKAARQENTNKWWEGIDVSHSPKMAIDLDNRIRNAERAVKQECTCPGGK